MRSPACVKLLVACLVVAFLFNPGLVLGCATCFGKSDSALAQGMNMGILVLLGFISSVLAGVAGFFVFLSRRSARVAARSSEMVGETTSRS